MVVIGQNFGGEAGVFGGEAGVFGGEASPPPRPPTRLNPDRPNESSPKPTLSSRVKLPKIHVPNFKGNIMEWQSFWEQFDMSVHSRSQLTNPERLAYLRQALKYGPAKRVVEGLSG